MFFWWDEAPRVKRRFYRGRVMGSLEGGCYLVAFGDCDELPTGVHEVVHIGTMAADNWSFYRTIEELTAAIAAKENVE